MAVAEGGYVEQATAYAREVVAGTIPACQWVRLACERQLNDLKRYRGRGAAYRFDVTAAERPCRFTELMPHIKGPKAGELIQLEPWQCILLTTIFGWLKPNGRRRFRRVYVEVPRGNAKSTLSSTLGLYMLALDNEGGAEVYSLATTREQAHIVFGTAQHMAMRVPKYRKAFGVTINAKSIVQLRTAAKFMALAAESSTLDGLNIHFGCVDELHAHKTRKVYDVVETGTGKRDNSLLWVITTAGSDVAGICYEVHTYVKKVLQRVFDDEQQFAVIYTIDPEDDWRTEAALQKANPNWGVSVEEEMVRGLQLKAQNTASAFHNFLTKHLNVWVTAGEAWINMLSWDACADPTLRLEDFAGKPCYFGLDLATKVDIAAKVYVFYDPARPGHVWVFGRYYLPQLAVETGANSQYAGWAREGLLAVTDGAVTDFDQIEDELLQDMRRFKVKEVPYDPWQATHLANHMLANRVPMVELRQIVGNMSEPMKAWEALVLDGCLHHNGDPVLKWMVSNVVCKVDKKDNVYPYKEQNENKIDGAVAGIMALGRYLRGEEKARTESGDTLMLDALKQWFKDMMGPAPKAAAPLTGKDLLEAFGGVQSYTGRAINEQSAMCVSAVYAAVSLIGGAVASLPLAVYRAGTDGERERVDRYAKNADADVWWLLNQQPHHTCTAAVFWEYAMWSILLHGDFFALIDRRGQNNPGTYGFIPVHPDRVQVQYADDGAIQYLLMWPMARWWPRIAAT